MLHTLAAAWPPPESDAAAKEPPLAAVPTRAARSQSLTEPATAPLVVSAPVGLTLLELSQRRDRRAMSAEFSLSMLQQELGYPTRKASRGGARRDSIDRASRRTRSIREEDEGCGGTVHSSSSMGSSSKRDDERGDASEPEPERVASIESNRSASAHREEDDDDDNFMDARVASITGFSQDTDGVVYYEIIVRSVAHGPLSAYKVRRRYSEFRELHRALSKIMPSGGSRRLSTGSAPFGDALGHDATFNDEELVQELENSGLLLTPSSTGAVLKSPETEPRLPPLPDRGGLWSYLQFDTTPFLERRAQHFHAMLVAAQRHRRARESRLLNEFLGPPPDAVAVHTSVENSYVSLNRFAAPKLRLSVEAQERKQKARNISRRRSSLTQLRHADLP